MTPQERQHIMDIADLQVHRYFDHYLTEVFPKQIDAIMEGHNQDAEAHEPRFKPLYVTRRKFERYRWMILGGVAVVGCVSGIVIPRIPDILKALWP